MYTTKKTETGWNVIEKKTKRVIQIFNGKYSYRDSRAKAKELNAKAK